MPLHFLIPGGLLLLGVALLALGVRGRRVSDHPHCQRCGFDLFGSAAEVAACPECGADLTRRRAVQEGLRRRRPVPLTLGAMLLVLGVGLTSVALWARAKDYDWNRVKPTWWLRHEIAGADPVAIAAYRELERRAAAGAIGGDDAAPLADAALADRDRGLLPFGPRQHVSGVLLQSLRTAGQLDDARWQRFARQAPPANLRVRRVVRSGQPIPFTFLGHEDSRVVRTRTFRTYNVLSVESELLEPPTIDSGDGGGLLKFVDHLTGGRSQRNLPLLGSLRPSTPLPVGDHVIRFRIRRTASHHGKPVVTWEETATADVKVVAPTQPAVALIAPPDPASLAAIIQGRAWWNPIRRRLEGDLRIIDPNAAVAGAVYVLMDGEPQLLGKLHKDPTIDYMVTRRPVFERPGRMLQDSPQLNFSLDLAPPPPTLQFVIRPDPELAAQSVGILEIWGTEIRLTVPVRGGGSGAPVLPDASDGAQG